MTHGSLYTGIGGWLLAARWAEIENIFTSEKDPFCNKVINKRFPEIPKENRHGDIRGTDFTKYKGAIDIVSTSDPCQGFSFAGKRRGKADHRYLWPETIRAVRESKPPYVVFENVPGFISLGFETVTSDLEAEGYTVESFVIPACGIWAWHRRDRLWVIAYDEKCTRGYGKTEKSGENKRGRASRKNRGLHGLVPNPTGERLARKNVPCRTIRPYERDTGLNWGYWEIEPKLDRVVSRISSRVDRLKSLGNSIVPQIAYIIFEAIKQVNESQISR